MSAFQPLQRKNHALSTSAKPTNTSRLSLHTLTPRPTSASERDRPVAQKKADRAPRPAYSLARIPVLPPDRKPVGLVQQVAQEGIQTPSSTLPFVKRIQQSFGRHNISQIQAHLGPGATKSAETIQAAAYTTRNHVVFAGVPSLHTVAHEATHVVQQRAGLQLAGGTGKVGDIYEQYADAVANRVTTGQSVEGMLDQFAGRQDEMPGVALHSNREHSSLQERTDFQSQNPTNATRFDQLSVPTANIHRTGSQPVIQMQVKIELKENINDLSEELAQKIHAYNEAVEAFHTKKGNLTEKNLWEMLQEMLAFAQELLPTLPRAKSSLEEKLHRVTDEIRYAQAHIRPADPGLPALTMLPWNQMEKLGIASPFLNEHFENIFPAHQERGPVGGVWGPEKMLQLMKAIPPKAGKYNYVVLLKPEGGDSRTRQYDKVYEIKFCKEEKELARGGHIDLAHKGLIAAGGEIEHWGEKIKHVDNSSGHYLPKGPSPKVAVINAFKEAGLGDISDRYVEKKWSPKKKAWVKEEQSKTNK